MPHQFTGIILPNRTYSKFHNTLSVAHLNCESLQMFVEGPGMIIVLNGCLYLLASFTCTYVYQSYLTHGNARCLVLSIGPPPMYLRYKHCALYFVTYITFFSWFERRGKRYNNKCIPLKFVVNPFQLDPAKQHLHLYLKIHLTKTLK